MNGRKSFVFESLGFGFKSLIDHVRLFVFVLLAETAVVALVIGVIGLLNMAFIKAVIMSQALQDYQECVGYNCASVVYQSGFSLMSLVSANIISLLISGVVLAIFFTGLDLGLKRIALDLHDRGDSSVKTLFSYFSVAPKALVAWILYCLIVGVGLICLFLPGFIALLRFAFFPYFIVDKNVGPVDALKMSYEVTKDCAWDVFAFWVALKIIIYISLLGWIGIVITVPLSTLAYAYFYRKLVPGNNYNNMKEQGYIKSAM